jgi:cholesterol oxidase
VNSAGEPERFDAVVVGSGFGGSVAAWQLAEAGKNVLLLERGRPWPPGSFPRSPQEVTHKLYWDPSRGKYGIFNIWSFKHLDALVSSGLGGGSLIYANVLLRKDEASFVNRPGESWPVTRVDLEPHYDAVEEMFRPQHYPIAHEPYRSVPKIRAFHDAADQMGWPVHLTKLAVTFNRPGADPVPGMDFDDPADNVHGRMRQTCVLCGNCDIGCNVGAKNTLDYTLLSERAVRNHVSIRTLCEVRTISPDASGSGYRVGYVEHDADADDQRPHDTGTMRLTHVWGERLVLAAGSIGTTWLLLNNASQFPKLGPALGSHFCGNGDFLGFVHKATEPGRSGGTEPRFLDPSYGPVITSYVHRDGPDNRDFYIEDAAYPEFLNWAWQVQPGFALAGRVARFALGLLKGRVTGKRPSDMTGAVGLLLGEQNSGSVMPLLGMGHDVPDGQFKLSRGRLELDWSVRTSLPYFNAMRSSMRSMAGALGGKYQDNPLWWFHRITTSHPVGGVPMGAHPGSSVIDPYLQAWHYPGLYIVDGAAMPGPVGSNPSLTIAALAHRAAVRFAEGVTPAAVS